MWVVLPSIKELITFPSADRDKLILAASFNLIPTALVLLYLSEPAKSTRFSFPNLNLYLSATSSAVSI